MEPNTHGRCQYDKRWRQAISCSSEHCLDRCIDRYGFLGASSFFSVWYACTPHLIRNLYIAFCSCIWDVERSVLDWKTLCQISWRCFYYLLLAMLSLIIRWTLSCLGTHFSQIRHGKLSQWAFGPQVMTHTHTQTLTKLRHLKCQHASMIPCSWVEATVWERKPKGKP